MLGTNAKTQFQAHVPCRTCATVCSAGVRKGLRVFHYSSSERSSLNALTHFAATKNEALREKLAYAASEWSVSPPNPLSPAATGGQTQHSTLRAGERCAIPGKEIKPYKPSVKTEYLLVKSLREMQLGLVVGVLNPFCTTDGKNVQVCGWM